MFCLSSHDHVAHDDCPGGALIDQPDDVLRAGLQRSWRTRETETGRETWDPVAGLWMTDDELVRNYRARHGARQILGSWEDTQAMNRMGL